MTLILPLLVFVLAFTHIIAPDHWMPILAISEPGRMSKKRQAIYSAVIGLSHSLSTSALSAAIAFIGLQFLQYRFLKITVSILLIGISLYISINAFRESKHKIQAQNFSLVASIVPDPSLTPIFLLASFLSLSLLFSYIILFVFVTTITLVAVVYLVGKGIGKFLSKLKPSIVDYVVSLMLIATAIYVILS